MPTSVAQNNNYNPRVLEEHTVDGEYNRKKRMVVVAILCLTILVGIIVWGMVMKKKNEEAGSPAKILEQLRDSSQPVVSTPSERLRVGQALEASSAKTTTSSEERMRLMNSFNQ